MLIAIGARFDDRITNTVSKFCPQAKIIHVDVDPASISKTVMADIPIVGPVDWVLREMIEMVEQVIGQRTKEKAKALAAWWEQIDSWRSQNCLEVKVDSAGSVIKPQQVIQALYRLTHGDAVVTSDVGQHQMFAALYYPFDKPRKWINSGGLGTMGFGLPSAMGVQIAFPEEQVVCVTGEGSIQMNIQELSTCAQYGLPIKIINLNNRALGMVKQWQDMQYEGRHSHSYMQSLPNFVALVEAYGHVGIQVTSPDELDSAMEKALALKDKLVFLDVLVDPEEHVYPMLVAPDGSMRDMWLSKGVRT